MPQEVIPSYGLYGEPRDATAADGIHIEAIEERSQGEDWVIKPHRHGKLLQILCIFEGHAYMNLDDKNLTLSNWGLVTIPSGVVHGFRFQPDSRGFVISLSDEALTSIRQLQDNNYLRPVLESPNVIDLQNNQDARNQLQHYIALMSYEFTSAKSARASALLLQTTLLLISIKRQLDSHRLRIHPGSSQLKTANLFRQLIEQHYKAHWQVSAYADALNVSTSTLNRVCRSQFDCAAKALIAARVIAEAKRRLVYTRQPVEQIAHYLGYSDPAYFSRVFKKHAKTSPGEYRRQKGF